MAVKAIVHILRSYADINGDLLVDCKITAGAGYMAEITLGPFQPASLTINTDMKTAAMKFTTDNWGFAYTALIDTIGMAQTINSAIASVTSAL